METKKDRINKLIEELGLSKNQFAKEIGTSSAMVSKITTKDINFGIDVAEKIISKYPRINSVWLLTGIGEMFNPATNNNTQVKAQVNTQVAKNFTAEYEDGYVNPEEIEREWELHYKLKEISLLVEQYDNKCEREIKKEYPGLLEVKDIIYEISDLTNSLNEIVLKYRKLLSITRYPFLLDDNELNKLDINSFTYETYKKERIETLNEIKSLKAPLEQLIPEIESFIQSTQETE